MKKISKIFIVALVVLLLAAGCTGKPRSGESTKADNQAAPKLEQTQQVNYECVEGKTALEILKEKYTIETKTFSGVGEFVESIGGIKAESGKNFWAFLINGKLASIGAGQYQCKKGETVEWKLEKTNPNL